MEIQWLPIGSVVLLEGGDKPLMICGRAQKEKEGTKLWDYCACPYPEGNISPDKNILFNKDYVEKLLFIGYQTKDEHEFTQDMDAMFEEVRRNS